MGRPPKYSNPATLQAAVDDYFEQCDAGTNIEYIDKHGVVQNAHRRIPYTMAGLAAHLGIARDVLNSYSRDEYPAIAREIAKNTDSAVRFSDIVSCARQKIERDNIEKGMLGVYENKLNILNLASNFGYATRSAMDVTSNTIENVLESVHEARRERKRIEKEDRIKLTVSNSTLDKLIDINTTNKPEPEVLEITEETEII